MPQKTAFKFTSSWKTLLFKILTLSCQKMRFASSLRKEENSLMKNAFYSSLSQNVAAQI